jgi:hypothetical protein
MKKTSIAPIIISLIIMVVIILLVVFYPELAKSTVLKPLLDLARRLL